MQPMLVGDALRHLVPFSRPQTVEPPLGENLRPAYIGGGRMRRLTSPSRPIWILCCSVWGAAPPRRGVPNLDARGGHIKPGRHQ